MSNAVECLDQNLKQQVGILQDLLNLADVKQEALVKNDLATLENITSQEEQLLREIQRLEIDRLDLATEINDGANNDLESITLAELAIRYPQLRVVHGELARVLQELRIKHKTNAQLLQQALTVLNFTIGLLTNCEEGTYSHPIRKEMPTNARIRLVDKKV